jgi:predicted nucleic acid-binding Zn ribbon protein
MGRTAASQPQLVRDLLAGYLDRSGLRAGVEAASVIDDWPELVGPGIAAVTRVKKVSDGVLVVGVATSAWLMELNLMKRELLSRTNAGKRAGKFRQIIFIMDG